MRSIRPCEAGVTLTPSTDQAERIGEKGQKSKKIET
jgi:hypothetical protein